MLAAALDAAGLTETLKGTGPFTEFAPTDAAFDAPPAGELDKLLADPSGDLKDILLYHVVPDEALTWDDIAAGAKRSTVSRERASSRPPATTARPT